MGLYEAVAVREPRMGCRSGGKALIAHCHSQGFSDKGCYNPGSTVPGGTLSLHTVGRAVDLCWDSDADNWSAFNEYVIRLVERADALGIQQVLFDGSGWSYQRPYWHMLTFPTDMHYDHAHVELTIWAADHLTVEQIDAALAPVATPAPAPPPKDDDMTLDEYTRSWGPSAERDENGVITLPLLETYDPVTDVATYKRYPVGDAAISTHQELKLARIRASGVAGS